MKFFDADFLKIFNTIFVKALNTECEYKSVCSGYENNSQTCNTEPIKSYCGYYKYFVTEDEKAFE